jgi:hypothetical protein
VTIRRRASTDAEFRAAIRTLDEAPVLIPARDWPGGSTGLDGAGLYSWWVDELGARDLTRGLGGEVLPGRIYAGQTGATKWPSGTVGRATLRSRISSQHLRGRIRGSTFRLTLASVLAEELGLQGIAPKSIGGDGEDRLSVWMRGHLTVAVHPFDERDVLGHLEHRVLAELDPPLNLDGRPVTNLRLVLTRLRAG